MLLWAPYAFAGVLAAVAACYLVVLAFAALRVRPTLPRDPQTVVTVVVPAHNEAQLIARCLDSLRRQSYPSERYDIVVVADNCSDDTAARAQACGATVLTHDDAAGGKGRALRWATDRILGERPGVQAIVVVDADSVVENDMLSALVTKFEDGADAVQGEYLGLNEDGSARSELRAAAFLLYHRVRLGGRASLGLPCHLVGNGMLFSRRLLETHPWDAFTNTEDLEYSIDLRLAGVRPVYASQARLCAPVSGRGRAAQVQKMRWEGGRFHIVRTRLPKLLTAVFVRQRWSLADAALDLAVPPLGLLALASGLGAASGAIAVSVGTAPFWALAPWLVAVTGIPMFVVVGLLAGRAPRTMWRALLVAPVLVLSELGTRLRLVGGLRETTWERTHATR